MAAALPLDGSVVKLRGVPYKAVREDIEKFFSGFKIVPDGILMRKNPDGRLHGEAFITFQDPDEATRATSKDREVFSEKSGDRFIRVYPTTELDHADMKSLIVSGCFYTVGGSSEAAVNSVVKIRSLPDTAKQIDVINFLADFGVKPNGVQLVIGSAGRCTGDAYVDFESIEDANRAVSTKDRAFLGEKFADRFVLLSISTRKEMREALGYMPGTPGFVKMKGLPYKATPNEVETFFTGYGVSTVHIVRGEDGRATGMAIVEFDTPDEATRSMEKNKATFNPAYGERFVTFQVISAADAKNQLARTGPLVPGMGMAGAMGGGVLGRMGSGVGGGMGPMRPTSGGGMGPMSKMGMGGLGGNMMMGNGLGMGMGGMGMANPMSAAMAMGMGSMDGGLGMGGMGMSPGMGAPNGPMAPQRPAAPPQGSVPAQPGQPAQQTSTPGWQATIDPSSGVVYYQNMVTGERSWTDPMWNK